MAGAGRRPGPRPGRRFGAYRITGVIGTGGMSVVYRGERADAQFARTVAINVMKPGGESGEFLRRAAAHRR